MSKKWLDRVNIGLGILLLFIILLTGLFSFLRPKEILPIPVVKITPKLPKNPFALPKEAYDQMEEPLLSLKFSATARQLPDLKRYLNYYGKNKRPDADASNPLSFFGFQNNKTLTAVPPHQKTYLLFDTSAKPPQWIFSPNNQETYLWMEMTPLDKQARISLEMKGENGELIRDPEAFSQFTLPEKEFVRYGGSSWEIGNVRVDGTLLARQRARWYGPDLFLERHGGKEYQDLIGKQRIDFGEGEDAYSVFVDVEDSLIWNGKRWEKPSPSQNTQKFPLMVVKKIEERLMNLELFDVDGKAKISLNLLKSNEAFPPQNIQNTFKFIGSRTRSQFVFEINKERMLLSPKDWLLFTDGHWKKLVHPEEIDDYVDRKTVGPLFVLEGVSEEEDQPLIVGTLFNASRTRAETVEIPMIKGKAPTPLQKPALKHPLQGRGAHTPPSNDFDDDDDDEEDDDE